MIKVLYVDDEPINLQLFQLNFKKKYEVFTALSGPEGLRCLETNSNIKVVISDMKMPEMNGIQFISKAKNNFPEITYFILTGYDINAEIAEALESGLIHKYFSKPFNIKEIDSSIENC
jgi:response regulator RpfG family c-di-GMP phosphodiesterase